jgi:hypothetical protein
MLSSRLGRKLGSRRRFLDLSKKSSSIARLRIPSENRPIRASSAASGKR